MTTHFFAAPDFLELLQFWDSQRHGGPLPEWQDDMSRVPPTLLPNLIVTVRPEARYRYVGAECVKRWGSDPTGKLIYDEVLSGAHGRYIKSLGEETRARRAPIFSAAVYQPDPANVMMTGRLYVPFTYQGSTAVRIILTLQLFQGSQALLQEIGIRGIVHEIRRDMIAMVPELCTKLTSARHYYQVSRHTHQRTLAQDIEAIARDATGSILIPLPCFEDPEPAVRA